MSTAQLPQATAQNQVGFAGAAVVGLALGSCLFQSVGRAWPFVADALSYLASAALVWRLRTDLAPAPATAPRHLGAETIEGLRWLRRQRLVCTVAVVASVSNFVRAALLLLRVVSAQRAGAGAGADAASIGLILSGGGVGGVGGVRVMACALLSGWVMWRWHFGTIIFVTLALGVLLLALQGLATGPLALGGVYGLIMFVGPIYNVVQFSGHLALILDALHGRDKQRPPAGGESRRTVWRRVGQAAD